MATKIRLRRTGTRNLALYRIVVVDSRSPRDGRFIETLGHYDPRKEGTEKVSVNSEKVLEWINKGSEVSETVHSLLKAQGFQFPVKQKIKRKKSGPAEKAEPVVEETPEQPGAAVEAPAEVALQEEAPEQAEDASTEKEK